MGCFVLEETLPEERKRSIFSLLRWAQVGNEGGGRDGSTSSTPLKGLFTRPVCYSLFCWGFLIVRIVLLSSASPLWRAGKKRVPCMSAEITTLQFMFLLHLVAEVLFLSSPEDIGGLQFSPREMGILFSIRPLLSNIFNVLAYPTLARRYSTESIFKWGMAIVCTSYYAGYLIFGLAASWLHPSHQTSMIVLFGLAILSAILGASGTACSQSLTSRSPSRAYLNKLNTAAEYTANAMHALGVIAGSNLWTLGAKYHILNGQLVWLVLVALSLVLAAVLSNIETLPSWQEREEEERAISPTSS